MNRTNASLAFAASLLVLGGCAKVAVRPEGDLPKPLVVATPAKVGVVVTPEAGNYTHKESRASVDYEADLGPSHKHLVEEIFKAEFTDAKMFESVDAARLEPGLMAIFEPRIEQFSFANAKETGGDARCRGEIPDAVPGAGYRQAAAGLACHRTARADRDGNRGDRGARTGDDHRDGADQRPAGGRDYFSFFSGGVCSGAGAG